MTGVLFCVFPYVADAAVVINEVAWMGTANSAADEWVEIYSDTAQDLSGWTLGTADGGMNITLSGSISADGYYLIERTDDTTVPNITADLVTPFGNGISNSIEILILKDANGSKVDEVGTIGDAWPAGDNATKETMQKSGSIWITALGTPKAANAAAGSGRNQDSSSSGSGSGSNANSGSGNTNTSSTNNSSYVPPEKIPRIKAYAGEDKRSVVGEEIILDGLAIGLQDEPLDNARYLWSFGDAEVREGKKVGHSYNAPGTYVVRLSVSSGAYSAIDDLSVVVSKNSVSISEVRPGSGGWIEFENSGSEPVHIGRWILEAGGTPRSRFVLPTGMTMAPRSFIVLMNATTGLQIADAGATIDIFYPNGSPADRFLYVMHVFAGKSNSKINGSIVLTDPTPGEKNKSSDGVATEDGKEKPLPVQDKKPQQVRAGAKASLVIASEKAASDTHFKLEATSTILDTSQEAALFTSTKAERSPVSNQIWWLIGSIGIGSIAAIVVVVIRKRFAA